jgi:hypothetical protein
MIIPPVKFCPYILGTRLSVAGGSCILTPGSDPLTLGASNTPRSLAVVAARPADTTPTAMLKRVALPAMVPAVAIAPTNAVAAAVKIAN